MRILKKSFAVCFSLCLLFTIIPFGALADNSKAEEVIFYEDFESLSDVSDVIYDIKNQTWINPTLCTTEAVSGSKCFSVYAMFENLYIPFDKSLLENDVVYNFSLNWKLLEYTGAKKRQLTSLDVVGWNPSVGGSIEDSSVRFSGEFTSIKATGEWINTVIKFKLSNLTDYEAFGVRVCYSTSTPFSEQEDKIYLDDFKLAKSSVSIDTTPLKIKEEVRSDDTIKVLAFGNSFSNDTTTFIRRFAAADGVDLRVGDCSISGCSLERHFSNMFNDTKDYTFRYRQPSGTTTTTNVGMYQALTATDWDYITIQQSSNKSGMIDTFEPYLTELISYFREICPNATILLHMTWAYQEGYDGLSYYENSQSVMYEAIQKTYITATANNGYLRIIPSGAAIEFARDTSMGDNFNRDGFHLNDKGRILTALTWYETFTGISALDTSYNLLRAIGTVGDTDGINIGITSKEDDIIRNAAHNAASLFKNVYEAQLAIEAIGTVTKNSGYAINYATALRKKLNNDDFIPNISTLDAAVEAFQPWVKGGDIDSNLKVDLSDVVTLAQYVAEWDVPVNEHTVDVNGDKTINLRDVIYLSQYIFECKKESLSLSLWFKKGLNDY